MTSPKFLQETRSAAIHPSFWGGMLLGLPVAYPTIPYYLLSFLVFGIVLLQSWRKLQKRDLLLVTAMIASALLSNVVSDNQIDAWRTLYTSAFFAFFLFGALVPNRPALIQGFVVMCGLMSIAVIFAACIQQPWQAGLTMFTRGELRIWGMGIFPDWPNFLAFLLSCGFLLSASLNRSIGWSLLIFSAAILTTSRLPLLALGILILVEFLMGRISRIKIALIAALAVSCALLTWIMTDGLLWNEMILRLVYFGDRAAIFGYAWELFEKSPIFGMGSILFDQSVGHTGAASFHNSYLDIMIRHGLVGILFYVALIWPRQPRTGAQRNTYWTLVLFFIISAFFQNILKHPHLLMLYTVILASGGLLKQNEK